jgi:peptidoglycan/xylan/chitin deacetylase (PgdA/CDA1 family)
MVYNLAGVLNDVLSGLRDGAKRLAHGAGGLPAYHRARNARSLTVMTFHRVLDPGDPRFADADPDWTVTTDELARCVAFAKRHYTVVSLEQVLEARRRSAALPRWPLLITFDDGWADNEEYALPVLEAAGVPAVIFVSGDAVGRATPFWREALRTAWQGGRIDDATWSALCEASGLSGAAARPTRDEAGQEQLIAHLSRSTRAERDAILGPFGPRIHDGRRHMLTEDQIRRLKQKGIAIGAHGRTHEPLTACEDLDDELLQPRSRLEDLTGEPVTTLALPHSRFTPEVLQRAARAGYELVFTGEPELAPVRPLPFAVGRVPITPGSITDARRQFRPERLALHLFRRGHLSAWA